MKRLYLLLIVILSVVIIPNTYAYTSFEANDTLTINQDYNNNAFFTGRSINANSYINGIGFYAGESISAEGTSDYSFFAGNSINVKNYKSKDIFAAGNAINIESSELRNVYAAGNDINIKGDASTLYIGGNNINLDGNYIDVVIDANNVVLSSNTNITGTFKINDNAKVTYSEGSKVNKESKYKSTNVYTFNIGSIVFTGFVAYILLNIFDFIGILIVGFIFILIFKNTVKKIDKLDTNAGFIFGRLGLGFLSIILIPIVSILLLFTIIGTPLGIIGLFGYILMLLISGVIFNIYFSSIIFKKKNIYLRYFLIALILFVIKLIPGIGQLVGFLATCIGMGIMISTMKNK